MFAVRLAEELRRRGHDASLAFLHPGPDVELASGAPVLSGPERHALDRLLPLRPQLLRTLRRLLRDLRPDVVQLNGGDTVKYGAFCRLRVTSAPDSYSPVRIYRNIGRPRDWVQGAARSFLYRRLVIPRMDGVAAVSRSTLAEVQAFYRPDAPTVVIPTAVDPEALQPQRDRPRVRLQAGTPPEAPVVIQVGSLSPEKRPDRLLSAFATVLERIPDAHLWFLGDGPLRSALEAQCREESLSSVRFLGSHRDVGSFLAAADLLALVSDTEGLPAAVLEAGWLGLPVVATRVGGVPECVIDGETGRLVEPGDDDALGHALADLLTDPERRRMLGAAGRRLVEEESTFERVADRFIELYRTARRGSRKERGSSP